MKKITIPLTILILIVIAFGIYFYFMYYGPIVTKINGEKIYLSDYNKNVGAVLNFYELQKKALKQNLTAAADQKYKDSIKKTILQTMIEDKIIEFELKNTFDVQNQGDLINSKVEKALSENPDVSKNVKLLYNLNLEDFKRLILYSAAIREILTDKLKEKNINDTTNWFLQEDKKYDVEVYYNSLKWNKENGIVE